MQDKSDQKAKRLIISLLKEAGGELAGPVQLNVALYKAHLFHWQAKPGVLTDHPFVKGPLIPEYGRWGDLISTLLAEQRLRVKGSMEEGNLNFALEVGRSYRTDLPDGLRPSLYKALEYVRSMPADKLVHDVQRHSRCWRLAQWDEELNIYIDLLSESEFQRTQRRDSRLEATLDAIFRPRR